MMIRAGLLARKGLRMNGKRKFSDWLIPLGLVALAFVPVAAGTSRLIQLATGAVPAEAGRFVAVPFPVILHIIAVTLFSLLGAFQFAPSLRRRFPLWHRRAGRVIVPTGLVAALTGLWMSHFYVLPRTDGTALYLMRLIVGGWMILALVMGYRAIRRRAVGAHSDWMLRGYAIGMGAGTQVLTSVPYFIAVGMPDTGTRAVLMGAGWGINAAVAEWIIARRKGRTVHFAIPVPPAGVFPSR
jgi:uncharacterized membrane protein YozB (DUF420 family)